jgi:hypothetical protein
MQTWLTALPSDIARNADISPASRSGQTSIAPMQDIVTAR